MTTDTLYGFKFCDPFSFSSPSDVSSYIVYVGRHQINSVNPHESSHRVKQVKVPSGYVEPHSGQDVALVELSTPITWSDYVSPICLPSSGTLFPSGMQCYVTGWGNIRDDGRCSPHFFCFVRLITTVSIFMNAVVTLFTGLGLKNPHVN